MNGALLRIADLHYGYGDRAVLKGIDLIVRAGEVVSLVGPNGAGKSTLLKCVNNVLEPARGDMSLDGRDARYSRRALARAIAYVPQQQGPAISLPVTDMIALGRAPHRAAGTRARDRIVLDAVEHLACAVGDAILRGAQRRRTSTRLLGRALAQGDRLLLLDEPTSALDLKHQLDTMTTVRMLARTRGSAC